MADYTPTDARIFAPAAARNAPHIEAELARVLPKTGRVLEIAAGSGEHAVRFARAFPGMKWQPTDIDPTRLASIAAWAQLLPSENLRPPRALNAAKPGWAETEDPVDAVLLVNLLHLISDAEAEAILEGIAQVLTPGGIAVIYGPFLRDGQATSPGDAAFHAQIQADTSGAGYKDVAWVQTRMAEAGLTPRAPIAMPANNLLLLSGKPAP